MRRVKHATVARCVVVDRLILPQTIRDDAGLGIPLRILVRVHHGCDSGLLRTTEVFLADMAVSSLDDHR